jgi:hypothetical protein
MLFDLLDSVLFSKKKIDTNIGNDQLHPYIINRWISMYSTQMTVLINNTGNWLYNIFDTPDSYFKFLQTFLPRVANRRIFYIKKTKKQPTDTTDQTNELNILAYNLELSTKEIKCLLEYERQHRPTDSHEESN